MLLSVKNISVRYGLLEVVKDISIEVKEREIIALIGSNGAGKTTTLRAISGLNPPSRGEIWFQDQRIDHLSPPKIVELGISQVPEGKRLFGEMTVLDNLLMGAYLKRNRDDIKQTLNQVYSYFPVLKERARQQSSSLSGGEQQMLATARALMAQPKLLLLDEPSLGLSPLMTQTVASIITTLNQTGIGIVLVEQNAELALELATRCYVLETGSVVIEGESKELLNDKRVKKAYLGM
jgi:branched-chain amino acid transport system ATP-binding protein